MILQAIALCILARIVWVNERDLRQLESEFNELRKNSKEIEFKLMLKFPNDFLK